MIKYPKNIRRELRTLAGQAHKRYLDRALSELQEAFFLWKIEEIDGFDLNEAIHRFLNGKSRELHNYFIGNQALNGHRVARAIVEGVISETELSKETLAAIANIINRLRSDFKSK